MIPRVRADPWRRAARVVSVLLHPFAVFAAIAMAAAWRLDPGSLGRTAAGIGVAVAIVWAFVLQRHRGGHWRTVDASRRQERPLLYLLVLLVAGGYWWWMGGHRSAASQGVLAAVAMLCIAAVANRWIKLSLHMASLAFAGMVLWRLLGTPALAAFALLPLLGWSRLRLGRHTPAEVLGGTLLGLTCGGALVALA